MRQTEIVQGTTVAMQCWGPGALDGKGLLIALERACMQLNEVPLCCAQILCIPLLFLEDLDKLIVEKSTADQYTRDPFASWWYRK